MERESRFRTTRWSLVLTARSRDDPASEQALSGLCRAYWYPLYVFVRRQGHDSDAALDLTQEFFLRLMERDWLQNVRPEAGRFRSFLLATMKHFLAHEHRRATRHKRGGGRPPLSLDARDAEGRYRVEPADRDTPERAYERRWALAVLDRARQRIGREMDEAGKTETYRLLEPYLTSEEGERAYRETAALLGSTEPAVKMAVLRLRRRFGRILRDEIAHTVDDDAQVDDEVRHLLAVIRQG